MHGKYVAEDIVNTKTGEIYLEAGDEIDGRFPAGGFGAGRIGRHGVRQPLDRFGFGTKHVADAPGGLLTRGREVFVVLRIGRSDAHRSV